MSDQDVDWGGQRVRLLGNGTRQPQWVAASPAFFLWLARYLAERPRRALTAPLWVTRRRPTRPLGTRPCGRCCCASTPGWAPTWCCTTSATPARYAWPATRRSRWSTSRPTFATRHLSTTEAYLVARPEEVIRRVHAHQQATPPTSSASAPPGWTYQPGDLHLLLGERSE